MPPLTGTSNAPVKPEPVKTEVAKPKPVNPMNDEGLPPLETAEDETFDPEAVKKKVVEKTALPPLPDSDVKGADEGLKEIKEIGEVNNENQETPPPPPPEETPMAPGKMEDKPLATEGIDMGDGNGKEKKEKKKINKKTIVGAVIALVLLIGVPMLALNLGYFSGDIRERAAYTAGNHCTDSGASNCVGKVVGEKCGNGGTCKKVDGPNNTRICGCVGQRDPSSGCNGGIASGCGAAPDPIPSYDKTGSVGPFSESGNLVVYLTAYDMGSIGGATKIYIKHNGVNHEVLVPSESVKQKRITTDIKVSAGDTIDILGVDLKDHTQDSCSPIKGPPFKAIGWMSVGADSTCGTGLPGPPTGGKCTAYPIHDVSTALSWADGYGNEVLGRQCWADWMEWTGDYDFNDFLLQFSTDTASSVGMCIEVKIYTLQDSVWTETAAAEVGQYAAVGDTIRLALKGNSSTFVTGRFNISVGGVTGSWVTTSTKNGNGELYLDYELENGGSYSVEGEIRK